MSGLSRPVRRRRLYQPPNESIGTHQIPNDDEERVQCRKALTPVIEESLTPNEVNSHFALCQKLFAENRNDDDDGDCDNNELPNDCDNNEFPNDCDNNEFPNDCENNKVQNDCNNNKSPNYCDNNKAPNTDENTVTDDQQQPPFGQTMEENEDVQAEMDANAFDTSLPIIIDPIEVPYAKQAEKVNIKRVKAIMTEILIAKGVLSASANSRPEGISRENFMQVYLELLEHLPEQMLKEMSGPIAYFALLQFTNERGLLLKNSPDFKDVVVSNEVPDSHLLMDD